MRWNKFYLMQSLMCVSLLLGVYGVYCLTIVTPENQAEYNRLVEESQGSAKEKQPYVALQERQQVCKECLTFKNGQRLKTQLKAQMAALMVEKKKSEEVIEEYLKNVYCTMEEEVPKEANYRLLRTLDANSATYCYQTGRLVAHDVLIQRFMLPQQPGEEKATRIPLLSGRAEEVELYLSEGEASFQAKQLHINFLSTQALLP